MLFSNSTTINKKTNGQMIKDAKLIFVDSVRWLDLPKGPYFDTGYYALFNGIYIIKSLLDSELQNKSINFSLKLSGETQILKDLVNAFWPYGSWRQFIINSRKTDNINFGSWLTSEELNELLEHEKKNGLLKNLEINTLLLDYAEIDTIFNKQDLGNSIILVNDCDYWIPLVSYKAKNRQKNIWFGALSN